MARHALRSPGQSFPPRAHSRPRAYAEPATTPCQEPLRCPTDDYHPALNGISTGVGGVRIVYDVWTPDTPPRAGGRACRTALGEYAPPLRPRRAAFSATPGWSPTRWTTGGHGRFRRQSACWCGTSPSTRPIFDTPLVRNRHPGAPRPQVRRASGTAWGGGIVFAYGVERPDNYDMMVLSAPAVGGPGNWCHR